MMTCSMRLLFLCGGLFGPERFELDKQGMNTTLDFEYHVRMLFGFNFFHDGTQRLYVGRRLLVHRKQRVPGREPADGGPAAVFDSIDLHTASFVLELLADTIEVSGVPRGEFKVEILITLHLARRARVADQVPFD